MSRICSLLPVPSPATLTALFVACLLAGCAGSATDNMRATHQTYQDAERSVTSVVSKPKPVDVQRSPDAVVPQSALTSAEETALRGVIEQHARAKNEPTGTYVLAGADLNGDGRAEALVLFTSENWCQPHGCPLVIFQKATFGWRHVATINRVRPPIQISANATQGWRDLWVMTGKDDKTGKLPLHPVLVKWNANSYPGSTALTPSIAGAAPEGTMVIASATLKLPDKARIAKVPGKKDEESSDASKSTAPKIAKEKSDVKLSNPKWY